MKRLPVFAGLAPALVLGACASLPPPAVPLAGGWKLHASATAGSALVRNDAKGREALRIACRRNPADLYVASDLLRAGPEPVLLSIGDKIFTLAPTGDEPRASGTAPIDPALPAALMSGAPIGLREDGRAAGPFPGPDAADAAAFVIACRG